MAFSGPVKNRRDLEVIVKEGERVGEALVPLGGGGGGSQDRGIYPLINRHSSANKRFTLLQYQDFIYKTEFFHRKRNYILDAQKKEQNFHTTHFELLRWTSFDC